MTKPERVAIEAFCTRLEKLEAIKPDEGRQLSAELQHLLTMAGQETWFALARERIAALKADVRKAERAGDIAGAPGAGERTPQVRDTPRMGNLRTLTNCQEISVSSSWEETVVPIAVERVFSESQFGHLLVGNLDPWWIYIRVQIALDGQTCLRGGGSNEVDDRPHDW